jgi:hypothetical protein
VDLTYYKAYLEYLDVVSIVSQIFEEQLDNMEVSQRFWTKSQDLFQVVARYLGYTVLPEVIIWPENAKALWGWSSHTKKKKKRTNKNWGASKVCTYTPKTTGS